MAGWMQPWAWRNGLLTTLALAFLAWVLMLAGVIALQSRCDALYSNQARPRTRGAAPCVHTSPFCVFLLLCVHHKALSLDPAPCAASTERAFHATQYGGILRCMWQLQKKLRKLSTQLVLHPYANAAGTFPGARHALSKSSTNADCPALPMAAHTGHGLLLSTCMFPRSAARTPCASLASWHASPSCARRCWGARPLAAASASWGRRPSAAATTTPTSGGRVRPGCLHPALCLGFSTRTIGTRAPQLHARNSSRKA